MTAVFHAFHWLIYSTVFLLLFFFHPVFCKFIFFQLLLCYIICYVLSISSCHPGNTLSNICSCVTQPTKPILENQMVVPLDEITLKKPNISATSWSMVENVYIYILYVKRVIHLEYINFE